MTAPCGTLSAYKRHRKNNDTMDSACQAAWDEYSASRRKPARDTANAHCREMDKALAERPPVIVWKKNHHGVSVYVLIDDPHAEKESSRNQRQQEFYTKQKGDAA